MQSISDNNPSHAGEIFAVSLGRTQYTTAWDLQKKVFEARSTQKIPNVLLLTEHEHVYTLGKSADSNHLLSSDRELAEKGVEIFAIDRGGDITYHGPGQLVGYPIFDLRGFGLNIHSYLRCLEELLIRTLGDYDIEATRDPQFTGVWVRNEKIAAIGIRVSRSTTMHGFALNVNTDLSYFDRIIPCGIFHKGVTSIQRQSGQITPIYQIESSIIQHASSVLGAKVTVIEKDALMDMLDASEIEEFNVA